MAEIALALAVTSALTQYQAGREAKKGYESRAKFKALEGRVEGVKAKEQGIQALKNTQQLLASVSASAYSGGLEPNISGGSIENFVTKNILQPGYGDFATARDNQIFIRSCIILVANQLDHCILVAVVVADLTHSYFHLY